MVHIARGLFAYAVLVASACGVSRGVDVVPFIPPATTPSLSELVASLESWAEVDSLVLRVDLQFETVEEAEEGRGRQYRTAEGRLLLERPASIRLNIEAPILGADIAEMASDGDRFQLLIHPPEYRALIVGDNQARYESEVDDLRDDPELEEAGPLVNIRPQHFTEALLVTPIEGAARGVALLHEEYVVEPDLRPRAGPEARVRRSYYVVTTGKLGEPAASRRYWFDRTADPKLARQQVYEADGGLVADVSYSDYLPPDPETGVRIPARVRIERPGEDYSLTLTVRPDGVEVNRELPESAFVLTPPETWGDTLRRIDLDERARQRTDGDR